MALIVQRPSRAAVALPGLRLPGLSARAWGAASAVLFVLLTVDLMVQSRAPFDLPLIRAIQRIDLPLMHDALRPVDFLTSSQGAIAMWGGLLAAFVLARWWLPALGMLVLPAGGALNHAFGEYLVHRGRPAADEVSRVIGGTDAPSFPSGHVMGAVMLYGFLFVVADRIALRPARVAVKVASVAIPAMSGSAVCGTARTGPPTCWARTPSAR